MRVILTVDGRNAAFLLENDAEFHLGRMDKPNDVLKCTISPEKAKELAEQLKFLSEGGQWKSDSNNRCVV